jgi:hypothetical protein
MSWRDSGNTPINSTGGYSGSTGHNGLLVNPSTSDIMAEIGPTQFANVTPRGGPYLATLIIGASTLAVWQVELATSTDLSVAPRDLTFIHTPSGQSGQYQLTFKVEQGDRLRARLQAGITGVATAKISAEPLT